MTLRQLVDQFLFNTDPANQKLLTKSQKAPNGKQINTDFRDIFDKIADMEPGATNNLSAIAGENLSGGKVIYISAGKAYHYSADDDSLYHAAIGFSVGAAAVDTLVEIQTSGVFSEVGFGLTPDTSYYAGIGGALTTDPSTMAVYQFMGRSISTEEIKIDIQTPIVLLLS